MKLSSFVIILTASLFTISCNTSTETAVDYTAYTNKFIGTGLEGRISPVASVPFGMMQIAPDTRSFGSGYHYEDSTILGFSHLHKSGGGCADFLDILFLPLHPSISIHQIGNIDSKEYNAEFNHDDEIASPGYYSVNLYNDSLQVELTASRRCGIQRYQYKDNAIIPVLIDLEYGSQSACTIQPQHDVDTVFASHIEV
ncbi:MAG: GH92 family glycosyl hydrolase, partial [Tannerellaceae bacterium]